MDILLQKSNLKKDIFEIDVFKRKVPILVSEGYKKNDI